MLCDCAGCYWLRNVNCNVLRRNESMENLRITHYKTENIVKKSTCERMQNWKWHWIGILFKIFWFWLVQKLCKISNEVNRKT